MSAIIAKAQSLPAAATCKSTVVSSTTASQLPCPSLAGNPLTAISLIETANEVIASVPLRQADLDSCNATLYTTTSTTTQAPTTSTTVTTTAGPNMKICYFTQDVGSKKACFASTSTFSFSSAFDYCKANGMFLLALNTDSDVTAFNNAVANILSLNLSTIVMANEYWINGKTNGTSTSYISTTTTSSTISIKPSGLGACLFVKKNLLLRYDVTASSCTVAKLPACQYN